jgi:uncharacterized protein YdbL (DUF1318 family)
MKMIKILLTSFLFMFTLSVSADQLDDAKEQGLVGEKPDGYLGVIVSSNATQELVASINAKRKSTYQQLANKNNLELSQVEALAAKKAFSKTETGHYIWLNGSWSKK